ncbi:low-complexity tail membrane protein [Leptolyngbya sp. AN02str]|uniref:low-complexity tail membrane protein n=1 Tax=Leptolyngbya sp. AN02str TaxID=3423363 RepID=UPI003D32298B
MTMVATVTKMRSSWFNPYLWVHLAAAGVVPLLLELCALGLAAGDPLLPVWMEVLLLGTVGMAPALWMQWQRPFSPFSLYTVALKPAELTEDQRRVLRPLKSLENQLLAIAVAVTLFVVLWQIYRFAPLAAAVSPFSTKARLAGLVVAAIAFLLSNILLQISASVLRVLLIRDATFQQLTPYPTDQISRDFTVLGWRVSHLLPRLEAAPPKPAVATATAATMAKSSVAPTTPSASSGRLETSPWNEDISLDGSLWDEELDTPSSSSASSGPSSGAEAAVAAPDSEPPSVEPQAEGEANAETTTDSSTEATTVEPTSTETLVPDPQTLEQSTNTSSKTAPTETATEPWAAAPDHIGSPVETVAGETVAGETVAGEAAAGEATAATEESVPALQETTEPANPSEISTDDDTPQLKPEVQSSPPEPSSN